MILIYLIQNSMPLGPEAAAQLATGQRMGARVGAADVPEPGLRGDRQGVRVKAC